MEREHPVVIGDLRAMKFRAEQNEKSAAANFQIAEKRWGTKIVQRLKAISSGYTTSEHLKTLAELTPTWTVASRYILIAAKKRIERGRLPATRGFPQKAELITGDFLDAKLLAENTINGKGVPDPVTKEDLIRLEAWVDDDGLITDLDKQGPIQELGDIPEIDLNLAYNQTLLPGTMSKPCECNKVIPSLIFKKIDDGKEPSPEEQMEIVEEYRKKSSSAGELCEEHFQGLCVLLRLHGKNAKELKSRLKRLMARKDYPKDWFKNTRLKGWFTVQERSSKGENPADQSADFPNLQNDSAYPEQESDMGHKRKGDQGTDRDEAGKRVKLSKDITPLGDSSPSGADATIQETGNTRFLVSNSSNYHNLEVPTFRKFRNYARYDLQGQTIPKVHIPRYFEYDRS